VAARAAGAAARVRLEQARRAAMRAVAAVRPGLEARADRHTLRVLSAFRAVGLAASDLGPSTGYGYDDPGRAKLEAVWARLTGAEAALVRTHIASGTAAVSLMLFAAARPGSEVLVATGPPYDTVARVLDGSPGALSCWGVRHRVLPFSEGTEEASLADALRPQTACVLVQRSRGYARRPALGAKAIGRLAAAVHAVRPDVAVVVDNCYGEFVEDAEPTAYGADAIAGSWVKNPGGGLAAAGGYVAGRADLVARAAARLHGPGQGAEVGAEPGGHRLRFQGLLLAPRAVAEALAAGVYASALFHALGFAVDPPPGGERRDLVTRVEVGGPQALEAAARAVQRWSPVDSRARPEPQAMPGYADPVLMAAGTFVQGAGLELTADAPMRPPWDLFLQGGLSLAAARAAVDAAAAAALGLEDDTEAPGGEEGGE
jgi:cystathionine beta-lyase family protein involved in aluminum resistance